MAEGTKIVQGTITVQEIQNTHKKIKDLIESYKDLQKEVSGITETVRENWVGKGRNEFESQYNLLISKIDDFGDTLQDIYEALVDAETAYRDTDDEIRKAFVMSMES